MTEAADLDLGEIALLAEDRASIAALSEERDRLRDLLQAWEPRVICPQCGQRYFERACGPTHAVVHALVHPLPPVA